MKGKGGYKSPVVAPAPYKKEPEAAQSGDNTSPPQLKARGGVTKKRLDKKARGGGNWIAGAIKHPGAEKKAAAKAGESTHEYMEKHKDSPGKAGQRARLGLRLSAMAKKK